MTPDPLTRLSELVERATAGPWSFDHDWHRCPNISGSGKDVAYIQKVGSPEQEANAALIVAAVNFVRSDLPQLLSRIAALEAERASLEKQVVKLSRANLFWIDEDPETGYGDPWEALESALYHSGDEGVAAIREGKELGVRFYARLRPDDEIDIDDDWLERFETEAQANAAIAAERERRKALRRAKARSAEGGE